MALRVFRHAFLHPRHLLGGRLALIAAFPVIGAHAMDHLTRCRLVERGASGYDPVSKAISAKSGKAHEVDILRIMAMAQVADQPAKGGSGMCIVQFIERIWHHLLCIHIHGSIRVQLFLGLQSAFAIG